MNTLKVFIIWYVLKFNFKFTALYMIIHISRNCFNNFISNWAIISWENIVCDVARWGICKYNWDCVSILWIIMFWKLFKKWTTQNRLFDFRALQFKIASAYWKKLNNLKIANLAVANQILRDYIIIIYHHTNIRAY